MRGRGKMAALISKIVEGSRAFNPIALAKANPVKTYLIGGSSLVAAGTVGGYIISENLRQKYQTQHIDNNHPPAWPPGPPPQR